MQDRSDRNAEELEKRRDEIFEDWRKKADSFLELNEKDGNLYVNHEEMALANAKEHQRQRGFKRANEHQTYSVSADGEVHVEDHGDDHFVPHPPPRAANQPHYEYDDDDHHGAPSPSPHDDEFFDEDDTFLDDIPIYDSARSVNADGSVDDLDAPDFSESAKAKKKKKKIVSLDDEDDPYSHIPERMRKHMTGSVNPRHYFRSAADTAGAHPDMIFGQDGAEK